MPKTQGALVAGGNAIRGTRVGAGPMGEAERGETAPRNRIPFWCANQHETRVAFASDADVPEFWDCPRCGLPAGCGSLPVQHRAAGAPARGGDVPELGARLRAPGRAPRLRPGVLRRGKPRDGL